MNRPDTKRAVRYVGQLLPCVFNDLFMSVLSEDEKTEECEEYECSHHYAGNPVYELEESRKAYDSYRSPSG